MITLQQLCRFLDEVLFVPRLDDSSANGLQIQGCEEVTFVATAVSASLETIKRAKELKASALLVHHGLFWRGDSFPLVGSKLLKVKDCIDGKMSLLAYHLPLDAHQGVGNNWRAASDLGWSDLRPFGIYNGIPIGVKGVFPPLKREEFQKKLETYYGHAATIAFGGPEIVTSAGLISGGAYKSILEASKEGLDCFVTGNFDEPAWHSAREEGVNFYALGHSATERVGPMALAQLINQEFGIKTEFLDLPNPF